MAVHIRGWMVLLRLAEASGRGIKGIARDGRPALITLAVATVALAFVDWWKVLVSYAALLLLWAAAKATTRVVIDTFEDHTGTGEDADGDGTTDNRIRAHRPDTTGMAGLLATRLGEMRSIYQRLEEPLGSPHPGRPVDGAVQLEDIGDLLRSAFTTQSNVSVGPVTLPIGAMMLLLGRLVQAPRLRGAIYGDDIELTLTADLAMYGREFVWRIRRAVGEHETPAQARGAMVKDLAYRVFTDLSLRGQAEWPATAFWFEALKERQACQRSPRDRRVHLENAEQHLRDALAEDERFYLAAYNLGIVYQQLAEEDARRGLVSASELRKVPGEPHLRSARRAFAHAIDNLDHGRWEAYYGLALSHWKLSEAAPGTSRRQRMRVIDLCDRALELAPGGAARAQIQDLQANAQLAVGRAEHALATWHDAYRAVLPELAIAEILRVRAEQGQRITRLRKQASQCMLNLAIACDGVEPNEVVKLPDRSLDPRRRLRRARRFGRIRALAASAMKLADVDAVAHARFATIAHRWGKDDLAGMELLHATRIDSDHPVYWTQLAQVLATHDPLAAHAACAEAERTIDFGSANTPREAEAIGRLADAYRRLSEPERAKSVLRRRKVGAEIARALTLRDGGAAAVLRALRARCEDHGYQWETALVERHLAELLLHSNSVGAATEAEMLFARAIKRLQAKYPSDVRRWSLLGGQATAIARQTDRTKEALPLAERGVAIDPLSSPAWRVLATVCEHGGDYERACIAWNRALLLEPDDPDHHVALALAQWRHAEWVASSDARRKLHVAGLDHLHRALRLYDSAQIEQRQRAEWWAAKSHGYLGAFAEMPPHLWYILASLEDENPSSTDVALTAMLEFMLALAYRRTRQYAKAEDFARRSIEHGDMASAELDPDAYPGARLDDYQWSLAEIRALARAQIAGCHAARDGRHAFAELQCRDAERILHALEARGIDITDAESDVLAARGRIALARGHAREAVRLLERSTRMDPGEADVYVSLAQAYQCLAVEQEGPGRIVTLQNARRCCGLAKDMSSDDHPDWAAADAVECSLACSAALPAASQDGSVTSVAERA